MEKIMNEEIYLSILEHLDEAVLLIDCDKTIRYINQAYEKQFHVKKDKLLGRKLTEFEENATIVKSLEDGSVHRHGIEYLDSLKIDTVGVSFPIYNEGKIVGAVAVFTDTISYVEMASKLQRTEEMNRYLMEQLASPMTEKSARDFITVDPAMKYIIGMMLKVAKKDVTVLLRGESGTGKEVAAKMIHDASNRSQGPYVKVNCAAIPDNLLESELFGYSGGAFTGAKREGKPGKFELAQNGTIFLDEIGDMDMNMQVKLLRVLQEKELERVGGTKTIKLNIRVVAATNRNLEQLIKEGKFRQDLYYRLNVIEVKIPPLRDRKDDIPVLTHHFIKQMAGAEVHVSPRTSRILNSYDWPGNVRELQNVLEHACIMRNEEDLIDSSSLPEYLRPKEKEHQLKPMEEVSNYNIKEMICELEKELIQEAIRKFPNKTKAIEELGISRRSFYEKIKRYNIEVGDDEEQE